jgi:hypothetical protein
LDTCYLAEYNNTGRSADISRRVKWKGYHGAISQADAIQFTAGQWLKAGTESAPLSVTEWFKGFKGLHIIHYLGFKP